MTTADYTQAMIAFYVGAYGPTIRVDIQDRQDLYQLRSLFVSLMERRVNDVLIHEVLGARLLGLRSLRAKCAGDEDQYRKSVFRLADEEEGPCFLWSPGPDAWWHCVGLLDGMLDREDAGHQYLSQEGIDDAIVVVAYGEPRPTVE